MVNNAELFFKRITQSERWGDSVLKFVMTKHTYPGIRNLVKLAER